MSMDTVHSWLLTAAWWDAWVSILKCGTTRWRCNVDKRWRDADPLSSSAPETAGCRTREMLRSGPSLWLPWTAWHPRPAGDPGCCSWCGKRCCDGWVEVPPVSCQRRPAAGAWAAPEVLWRWDTLGQFRPPLPVLACKNCMSWVIVLCMVVGWLAGPRRSNTQVLACCVLTAGIFLVTWDEVASSAISGTWQTTMSFCLPVGCYVHAAAVPLAVDPWHVILQTGCTYSTILRTCG